MYDPVLNRPMFQAQNTATPMAAAPMGAKGTGITSMVTSPDPDTTMQQLKAFGSPVAPTMGYADGGPVDQNALNGFNAYNAFLNNREGKPDNAVRTDTVMPTGPGQAFEMPSGYGLLSQGSLPTGLGGKNLILGQPGTPDPTSQSSMRAALDSQSPLGASPMGGGDSYDIFKSGLASSQAPSGSPSSISGKGVIIQTYADGGPVQHFDGGGLASMWQNFVNSRPVKSNPYAVGIPGTSYSGNEPSDSNERDYIRDTANAEAEGEYRRAVTSSQQYIDPEEFAAAKPDMEQSYREALRQQQDVDPNAFSGAPAGIPAARPKSVQNFENPYRNDNTSDRFEREQIEKMKSPPRPQERPPVEERSSISTELNKIREERKAQSAAERRENALMALMSAGFGMAAGKSRHALANIAEGGQQGIATFANLEKGRREDDNRRYLAELHERELRMNEPYKQAMTQQAQAQAEYLKTRPLSDQQRQQLRETAAMYAARKEAANEFIRRKKDDFNFAQQFNNPATGAAMEKKWMTDRMRELMPEMLVIEQNKANNSQGNVSPTNAE